jgi:hypothetical protein
MAEIERVSLLQDQLGWSVKVLLKRGKARRYRYSTEAQARYFAAVFGLGPRVLPSKFPLPMGAVFGEAAHVRRRRA